MHEEGGRRESLSWFEQRLAYGWEVDRPTFLERVFVKTKEGAAIPKVLYVELHGRDAATGKAVSERINNE